MRTRPTSLARTTRRMLTAATLAVAVGGMTLLTGGTASADPVVANSCTATVEGKPGEDVVLPGQAVRDLVEQATDEHRRGFKHLFNIVRPWEVGDQIAGKTLSVGTVSHEAKTISGATIGQKVRAALDGASGLGATPNIQVPKTLNSIENKVAAHCGFTVSPIKPQSSSTPSTSSGNGNTSQSPVHSTPPALGNGSQGGSTVSPYDYDGIPSSSAPVTGTAPSPSSRYGTPESIAQLDAPEFGILGAGSSGDGDSESKSGVHNAGHATAHAAGEDAVAQQVQLPMLLAVVALAGVTAALVRTWVLRRIT